MDMHATIFMGVFAAALGLLMVWWADRYLKKRGFTRSKAPWWWGLLFYGGVAFVIGGLVRVFIR
jgi:hypothetical protein